LGPVPVKLFQVLQVPSNVHCAELTLTESVALIVRLKGGQTLVTPASIAGEVTLKLGKVVSTVEPQAEAFVELAVTNRLKSEELGMARGLLMVERYSLATRSKVNQSYR
jgi:hypothetical protein